MNSQIHPESNVKFVARKYNSKKVFEPVIYKQRNIFVFNSISLTGVSQAQQLKYPDDF